MVFSELFKNDLTKEYGLNESKCFAVYNGFNNAIWNNFTQKSFKKAHTTVNPLNPEACSTLVDTGIYRYSRNPMYLALLLALAGWGIFLGNFYALVLTIAFVLYMNRFQIRPEEKALEALFGTGFLEYRRSVRRWL